MKNNNSLQKQQCLNEYENAPDSNDYRNTLEQRSKTVHTTATKKDGEYTNFVPSNFWMKKLITEKRGNASTNELIYTDSSSSMPRLHKSEHYVSTSEPMDQISSHDIYLLINENNALRYQLENTAHYIQYERLEYQRRLRHLSARIEYLEEIKRIVHSPDQFSNEIKPYHTSKKYLYHKKRASRCNEAPYLSNTVGNLTDCTRPNPNLLWIPETNILHRSSNDREEDIDKMLRQTSLSPPSDLVSPTCFWWKRWDIDPNWE